MVTPQVTVRCPVAVHRNMPMPRMVMSPGHMMVMAH
jgi:hypothetical protein